MESVFGNLVTQAFNAEFLTTHVMLTTKDDFVDDINYLFIDSFPGDSVKYYSFDSATDDTEHSHQEDFLHSLMPNGLPPHELTLKKKIVLSYYCKVLIHLKDYGMGLD